MTLSPLPASPDAAAAIYVRRSHKNAKDTHRLGRSMREQEADCRALAARVGLEVTRVYAEREGTGASRHSRKARPVWEEALRDLDGGEDFRTLIVWSLDRATRKGAVEAGELAERHVGKNRRVLGVDGTDTGDERARLSLIVRAEVAREEAEKLSERVSRARRYAREAGRWQSGKPPLGLRRAEDGRLEHDPETYALARRIAEMALDGISPYSIARTLNVEGVKASRGGEWRASSIRELLKAPGFAGLQSLRRKTPSGGWANVADVYLNEEGLPVSVGAGVITEAERARVLALHDERRGERGHGARGGTGGGPSTLLRGLIRCASCGRIARVNGNRLGHRSYSCASRGAGTTCEGFNAPEARTDEAVVDAFLRRLAIDPEDEAEDPHRVELLAEVARRWAARVDPAAATERNRLAEVLARFEADLARVVDLAAAGVLTTEEAAQRLPALRARVAEARAALATLPGPEGDMTPLLDMTQSREAWEALPVDERRALLGLAIERVTVSKAPSRGARFYPGERVLIHWVNPPGGTSPAGPRRHNAGGAPETTP
jgi:DNA invertase Pin-like site-specific DNA recombinase